MTAKVFGEFSIELEPNYHLIQTLPSNGNDFAAALLTGEKVLSFAENELEQRFRFNDIPCKNEIVPPDFGSVVPGTNFLGYDLSVPSKTKLGLQDISLELRDADNPKRVIKIKPDLDADDTADLLIYDSYPNRLPKSAKNIGRETLRNFLAWQLQDLGGKGAAFELASEQQLAMLLGQYGGGQRHTIRTAKTQLSEGRVLHAEKEEVFDASSRTGTPVRVAHSVWLTALMDDEILQLGKNLRARTVARLDGDDIWNPGNSLAFEVEATDVDEDDAHELTKQVMMLQGNKKLQTARAFTACIGEYLRSERQP